MHRNINPRALILNGEKLKLQNWTTIRVSKDITATKTNNTTIVNFEDSEFIPAEFRQSSKYSSKVDVYSAGVILLYMATAVNFYAEDTSREDWKAAEAMGSLQAKLENEEIYEMITRMLESDKDDRISTRELVTLA